MSTLPEDDDLMAAEYVLGTLSLEERAGAETRLRRDPDFARAVRDWEGRLSDLNAAYAEVPAPDLMPKIEAQLFPRPSPLRRGLRFFGGGLVAATLALAWLASTPMAPDAVARLAAEGGTTYEAALSGHALTVTRVAGAAADAAHAHELWLIVGEAAPVSLGLLDAETRLTLADAPEGALLAISLEPAGGSPTGLPTGPVVAVAPLQKS